MSEGDRKKIIPKNLYELNLRSFIAHFSENYGFLKEEGDGAHCFEPGELESRVERRGEQNAE